MGYIMSLLYTNSKDQDIVSMIAAEVHVGTQNCNSQMASYVYDRTRDGVFYLDLAKTWEKAMVAARIIAAIQDKNPQDVLIVSSRLYAQRAILKFATHTGANYMGGKWVPGSLTNQNTKNGMSWLISSCTETPRPRRSKTLVKMLATT